MAGLCRGYEKSIKDGTNPSVKEGLSRAFELLCALPAVFVTEARQDEIPQVRDEKTDVLQSKLKNQREVD